MYFLGLCKLTENNIVNITFICNWHFLDLASTNVNTHQGAITQTSLIVFFWSTMISSEVTGSHTLRSVAEKVHYYLIVFTWISAAALIKFFMSQMQHWFEGGFCLKVGCDERIILTTVLLFSTPKYQNWVWLNQGGTY